MGNSNKKNQSAVGRRDFMKKLGVGAGAFGLGFAGLNAAGFGADGFKDLDEMMTSPLAERDLPFWVKEVDEPTVEIDWENMEIFHGPENTLFNPASWENPQDYMDIYNKNIATTKKNVQDNVPGLSLKDRALADANCWGWGGRSGADLASPWAGADVKANPKWEHPTMYYTPEDYGVPKHQGTPEENSKMLRSAGRIMGASDMGFVKLDEKTKKLLWGKITFEDVEKGYAEPENNKFVLPNKDLWTICSVIPQSLWMQQYSERMCWAFINTMSYSRANIYGNRLSVFLRGLGYQAYGGDTESMGRSVGFGVMSGLGEYGRAGILVSPKYGTDIRTVLITITDLPLAVTKPIDAGITKFCETCKKCGEMCPSGAISMEEKPFWGGGAPWQAKGIKGWYMDAKKCYSFMLGGEPDCSRCQTVCPFTKFDEAVLHDLIKLSIGTAPMLNSAIRKMDDVFGYGEEPDLSKTPWDLDPMDIPLYGLDKSRS